MPEHESDIKELAKELAKESAKKFTSSVLSVLRGSDKKSSSSHSTPPTNTPSNAHAPGIGKLSGRLDALSLSNCDDLPSTSHAPGIGELSGGLNALSLNDSRGAFAGGFRPPGPTQSLAPWPTNTSPYAANAPSDYRPSFPIPVFSPSPRPPVSLTSQLAVPDNGYPGQAGSASPPSSYRPRPSSTPALAPPDIGLSASPKRPASASSRPSGRRSRSSSSSTSSDAVQCSGVTKSGNRCTRTVKAGPALAVVNPEADIERFCFQHTKEVLGPSGFYSKKTSTDFLKFEDWIPDYLQPDTQTALRTEMSKPHSAADVSGYIYTFEIRDDHEGEIKLKVGRAVNLVKRIDQWGKQCGSKEQILRGWWPDFEDHAVHGSLVKGVVKAGEKGPYCHRLERLVHLELADLSIHAPYLDPHFPKTSSDPPSTTSSPSARRTPSGSASLKRQSQPCPDCGQIHKEIFTFQRPAHGRYAGKEWEKLVKPVIEKWGAFVEAYV